MADEDTEQRIPITWSMRCEDLGRYDADTIGTEMKRLKHNRTWERMHRAADAYGETASLMTDLADLIRDVAGKLDPAWADEASVEAQEMLRKYHGTAQHLAERSNHMREGMHALGSALHHAIDNFEWGDWHTRASTEDKQHREHLSRLNSRYESAVDAHFPTVIATNLPGVDRGARLPAPPPSRPSPVGGPGEGFHGSGFPPGVGVGEPLPPGEGWDPPIDGPVPHPPPVADPPRSHPPHDPVPPIRTAPPGNELGLYDPGTGLAGTGTLGGGYAGTGEGFGSGIGGGPPSAPGSGSGPGAAGGDLGRPASTGSRLTAGGTGGNGGMMPPAAGGGGRDDGQDRFAPAYLKEDRSIWGADADSVIPRGGVIGGTDIEDDDDF